MALTPAQAKKRLDQIADLINELTLDAQEKYGDDAYIYFESEGSAHLMRHHDEKSTANPSERQKLIIASSKSCHFDCGAW